MRIEVIGNLGRDAEIKTAQDGRQFVTFSVADSAKVKGEEVTTWIDCTYNGTNVAQYLKKGCKVFVYGRLSARIYTKKDGTQNIALSCAVNDLQIVDFAKDGEQPSQPQTNDDMPF